MMVATAMVRYFIKTFGCKVNQAESADLHTELLSIGAQRVSSLETADVVILNGCTVTGEADRKVRKELRRCAQLPHVASLIITGCSAVLRKDELEKLDTKIKVLAEKQEIPPYLQQFSINTSFVPSPETVEDERIRIPLKIQDGCECFCSYCIVPFARGASESVKADEIITRVQKHVDGGTKEIILTGINLGNYRDAGTGKNSGTKNLSALIRLIQEETDLHRLRLSSIEPLHVSDDLLELLAEGSLLCEHLHIPLQSGSDYVLGEMNRNYSVDEYLKIVEKIRKANPLTAITTDIIVGFPSEGDDDFGQTMELVKEVEFAKIHVFRYSSREGTAAAKLKPLDPRLVKERAQRLQKQADLDALRYLNSRKGSRLELIIEGVEGIDEDSKTITGTSREYLRLELLADIHKSDGELLKPGDIIHAVL